MTKKELPSIAYYEDSELSENGVGQVPHFWNKWQKDISNIIIDASANCIPVLGLCYGHQLIGHIFGGKVEPLWSGEKKQGERIVRVKKFKI